MFVCALNTVSKEMFLTFYIKIHGQSDATNNIKIKSQKSGVIICCNLS